MLMKPVVAFLLIGLAPFLVSSQRRFAITGAPVPASGQVPVRRNINEIYSERGPQWDLYIQALGSLKAKNPSDPLSFFQVLGIHGLPFIEWNGGGASNNNGWGGYCPHGEAIFLPWHRPYILLYEQLLVREAVAIASRYPGSHRDQYLAAAQRLRSPYWDWSANSDVPPCTIPARVTIKVPNGNGLEQVQVDNPLQTYQFPRQALAGQFGPFPQSATRMVKCPGPGRYPDTPNQRLSARRLKQGTYDLFSSATSFDEFAVSGRMHLEIMHNIIHFEAGCQGQFLDPRFSAFDGLFMLHHTHVDRLWAYWQFIRPSQASFSYAYPGQARFSTPPLTRIGPNSPLQPFFDANYRYYTPNSVSSIKGMGYTYQGLEYWSLSSEQLQQNSIKLINSLYAPSGAFAKRAGVQGQTRHFIHVEIDRTQVERPCSINIFINGKPAASVPVMQQPECGTLRTSMAIDESLSGALSNASSSVENPVEVEITKVDGTIAALDHVDSLKISFEEVLVVPAKSDEEFPTLVKENTQSAHIQAYSKRSQMD